MTKDDSKYRISIDCFVALCGYGDDVVNKFIKHVPNILTLFRIVCVPGLIYFIIFGNQGIQYWIAAFAILLITGFSDVADGYIARKYNAVSNFGKVMDPIADKLLQYACLVCLYIYGVVPTIVLPVILIKELILGVGALLLYKNLHLVKGASWYGKVYTVIYFAAIYLTMIINLIFYEDAQNAFNTGVLTTGGAIREYTICAMMYLVALAGIWSLIMYTIEFFKIRRRALIIESNMPEGLSKKEQAKWLNDYQAQKRAQKRLGK